MAALQCEICGGKLMAKSGGLFECEYCGMQYDKTRIQEMVQQIKGTVKVEGTVEVKGTVKLDGPVKVEGGVSVEGLLKRAQLALEDGDWNSADEYCEKALDIDPECAQAYLGKLMAELRVPKQEDLYNCDEPFDHHNNYQKIIRFGDSKLRDYLLGCIEHVNNRNGKYGGGETCNTQKKLISAQCLISAGTFRTIGLKVDGTIIETKSRQIKDKQDFVAISEGMYHTVCLKADGTVTAFGLNGQGRCDVSGWTDIVAISAGWGHTVGLRADGTVAAVGDRECGQCDVEDWTDIVAISAGDYHTVGLRIDGTVVATKYIEDEDEYHGQCEVEGWTDIVAISAGAGHTVGLKADGTVVATKYTGDKENYGGQCDVSKWRNIIAVSAGTDHTVGLRTDGTVVATKYTGDKESYCGQCDVGKWRLFENFENLESERKTARIARQKLDEEERIAQEKKAEKERIARLKREEEARFAREKKEEEERIARERCVAGLCQHCGGELKGFFSKKCISCGKPKDY